MYGVKFVRDVSLTYHRFKDYFQGFENIMAVREIFGEKTNEVLDNLKVEFYSHRFGYMGVNDEDGHLVVSAYYLKTSDERSLYLDVIHELVHINQFLNGIPLFARHFEYYDRPTELEAYKHTVKEARRLGMTDAEIYDYLKVIWLEEEDVRKLAENVGVKAPS